MQKIGLMGFCSDSQSSFMRGPAAAPNEIRAALNSGSANKCSELGVDLSQGEWFVDLGDEEIGDSVADYLSIENKVQACLERGFRPLLLGGDHAVTYPIIRAIAKDRGPINILHFDAHPDLYDSFEGNPYSHACPFARIMEAGLCSRLVQVGIRTLNEHQRNQAARFDVEIVEMKDFERTGYEPRFDGPLYVSIDLDALDPAFAPGVSHHEPGGLSVRDIITVLHKLEVPIIGADVVELNPVRDINGMTAMVAAKLVKELAGLMIKAS